MWFPLASTDGMPVASQCLEGISLRFGSFNPALPGLLNGIDALHKQFLCLGAAPASGFQAKRRIVAKRRKAAAAIRPGVLESPSLHPGRFHQKVKPLTIEH